MRAIVVVVSCLLGCGRIHFEVLDPDAGATADMRLELPTLDGPALDGPALDRPALDVPLPDARGDSTDGLGIDGDGSPGCDGSGDPKGTTVVYYVAEKGSDAQSGLSVGEAWATLQHAANNVGPGALVNVAPGNYDGFVLTRSGADAMPIVFRAPAGLAVVRTAASTRLAAIDLDGTSRVEIDGRPWDRTNRLRAGLPQRSS